MPQFDTSGIGAWRELPFFDADLHRIERDLEGRDFLPRADRVFAALRLTHPDAVRVLILGQDPYPTSGHPNGLAFSTEPGIAPLPASLANVFRELARDLGTPRWDGDLTDWAAQGVLLLNTVLTVPRGEIFGHRHLGWQELARQMLERLDNAPRVLMLWGSRARDAARDMRNPGHLRIETSHPSPQSAHISFFGSRPFSRANEWLIARGEKAIDWTAP
jgi:uracil-DNA glycosylase